MRDKELVPKHGEDERKSQEPWGVISLESRRRIAATPADRMTVKMAPGSAVMVESVMQSLNLSSPEAVMVNGLILGEWFAKNNLRSAGKLIQITDDGTVLEVELPNLVK